MINNKGLNTKPSCNLIWTRKSSLKVSLTPTQLRAVLCIDCTRLNNCISMPNFPKAHHTSSLGTRSKAFSKSTNANYRFFFFLKYFSCSSLKTKMAFVVPRLVMKPDSISLMSTCCFTFPSS